MIPYLRKEAPWFTFLVHPRSVEDLDRWGGSRLIRRYSRSEEEYVRKATSLKPFVAGEIRFGFEPYWGEVVAVPRLPDQIVRRQGRRAVLEAAVEIAAHRGSPLVGLGALTSPVTKAGTLLVDALPPGVWVTTGNSFTAFVAAQNVIEAAGVLFSHTSPRVAVLGCTGSVGTAASLLLAEAGLDLVLIGRRGERVSEELPSLAGRAVFSGDLADVCAADIVLSVTGHPSSRLTIDMIPGALRPGTVVIDVAQPPNVPARERRRFQHAGVVVVPGGLVHMSACTSTAGLSEEGGGTFACLAETYLMARAGLRRHGVGKASVALARQLAELAGRYGVRVEPVLNDRHVATQRPCDRRRAWSLNQLASEGRTSR